MKHIIRKYIGLGCLLTLGAPTFAMDPRCLFEGSRVDAYAHLFKQKMAEHAKRIQEVLTNLGRKHHSTTLNRIPLQDLAPLLTLLDDIHLAAIAHTDRSFEGFANLANDPFKTILFPRFVRETILDVGSGHEGEYWKGIQSQIDSNTIIKEIWGIEPFPPQGWRNTGDPWTKFFPTTVEKFIASQDFKSKQGHFDLVFSFNFLNFLIHQAAGTHKGGNAFFKHFQFSQDVINRLVNHGIEVHKGQQLNRIIFLTQALAKLLKPEGTLFIGPIDDIPENRALVNLLIDPALSEKTNPTIDTLDISERINGITRFDIEIVKPTITLNELNEQMRQYGMRDDIPIDSHAAMADMEISPDRQSIYSRMFFVFLTPKKD